ncbi:modification methylase [Aminipila butyrica]|uniref:site-specific DNA-methyltransferase (cytosine-N(4)-specific) n=1 Tax=Aminipila butyrica TaxID=433296 RepID=A0A858BR28_9FIRM|nr:modification methylase [Aminipila butyrica]QIB68351.1 modification methylase [Aminipila butyrica]
MIEDISFKNYKKKSDIHGTSLYPAVMVAPVQKAILSNLISQGGIKTVFDPFHGSGTALYECGEIDINIHLIGCDINPLANLITKVKLQGIDKDFERDFDQLKKLLTQIKQGETYEFTNIKKWFKEDIIESLRILRTAIIQIQKDKSRLFFWYILCDIIRKYSNTRSSTYKLHIRTDDAINRIENSVIPDFLAAVTKSYPKFYNTFKNFTLFKCDIVDQMKQFEDNCFDITITSPPYGDNGTTVPYGQFSMLALLWIDNKDLELEGWELENYSIIDSKSIGGCQSSQNLSEYGLSLIQPYLDKICESKHKKVIRFFSDYFNVLEEICRVTNKYIVLTLGNRTVDRVKINLNHITKCFLENNNFYLVEVYERDIPNKRTPKKTSKVHNKPVESMNSEFVSIYRK